MEESQRIQTKPRNIPIFAEKNTRHTTTTHKPYTTTSVSKQGMGGGGGGREERERERERQTEIERQRQIDGDRKR